MRKKRPLDRKTKHRDASLVVIASEDRYAVRQYFDFFASSRIQFEVLVTEDGKSAPEHVLSRLDEYVAEYQIGAGDAFWLVCDTDHWIEPSHIRNLTQVLQQCRQKGVQIALSNPCFEFWLLLHFADFPPDEVLTCDEVATRLRSAAGGYNKTRVYSLHPQINDDTVLAAVRRAAENYDLAQVIPNMPNTAVHLIIEALIKRRVISVRPAPNHIDESGEKKSKKSRK